MKTIDQKWQGNIIYHNFTRFSKTFFSVTNNFPDFLIERLTEIWGKNIQRARGTNLGPPISFWKKKEIRRKRNYYWLWLIFRVFFWDYYWDMFRKNLNQDLYHAQFTLMQNKETNKGWFLVLNLGLYQFTFVQLISIVIATIELHTFSCTARFFVFQKVCHYVSLLSTKWNRFEVLPGISVISATIFDFKVSSPWRLSFPADSSNLLKLFSVMFRTKQWFSCLRVEASIKPKVKEKRVFY